MFAAEHVHKLFASVRAAAMVQYFTPYSTVRMSVMAEAFNTSVERLETELAELISSDHLSVRCPLPRVDRG